MSPRSGKTSSRSTRSILRTKRATTRELLDAPVESLAELEGNFNDIEAVNRFLGGVRAVRRAVCAFSPATIVDVGAGSADIPRALARSASRAGRSLRITCVDANADVLKIARRRAAGDPSLSFAQADGIRLPYADGAFDVAMCNLTLHHCDPPAAVALLRELRRVARAAPVVTDLRRSRVAWLGAKVLTACCTRNRLTRNDAPLSVLRAYTPDEALALAVAAGWRNPRVQAVPVYRIVLIDA
jgi:SAM-dependent methyltransferase